jgi:hypothetical protein
MSEYREGRGLDGTNRWVNDDDDDDDDGKDEDDDDDEEDDSNRSILPLSSKCNLPMSLVPSKEVWTSI